MIQEYLFTSDKNKPDLEELIVPEDVEKEIAEIENSSCWTLSLSIASNNENAAKVLDSLNRHICEKYTPTILSNGCSAYFNKALFPFVNEFERKLRKLLYLASALQGDSKSQEVIVGLESKDLGQIFEMLFSDASFVQKVKETVNKKNWRFTRAEILTAIDELEENTLWASLLGNDCVKTLCDHFGELRIYRNDVMHAHNINFAQYNAARKLFKKVNAELDSAIGKLINAKEANEEVTSPDFNQTLSDVLTSMKSSLDVSGFFEASAALESVLSSLPQVNPEVLESLSRLQSLAARDYSLNPEFQAAIDNLKKFASLQEDILPAANALSELANQMASCKIEIPTAILDLQQKLTEVSSSVSQGISLLDVHDKEETPNG